MNRRSFLGNIALASGALAAAPLVNTSAYEAGEVDLEHSQIIRPKLQADVIIAGAGLGGIAAALALLRNGHNVILTEETDWIGGQLTQQGVPPDEHQWIETHGAPLSYRKFRNEIREYYKKHYPLSDIAAKSQFLNPGSGMVSKLCHEPKVALSVLNNLLSPYISNGQLKLLLEFRIISAEVQSSYVKSLLAQSKKTKQNLIIEAPFFIDATELGDLLPLTGTEFVTGTESKAETNELHAPSKGDIADNQAFTTCFAMDYIAKGDFVQKPSDYNFWRQYIPKIQPAWSGHLLSLNYSDPRTLKSKKLGFDPTGISTGNNLNLWNYRKIINKHNFKPSFFKGDITLVNWPQNDYMLGNLIGASDKDFKKHIEASKQLGLSLLYWLQTEVERPDGGKGWPGLRLRKDMLGSDDGFAKYPYVRESRRIKAVFTILEEHVGKVNRAKTAKATEDANQATKFYDSVGIGYYHIDLHPTMKVNYVDFPSLRFQIPLGALLPIRMENILPANKNIGTTHITNGCYRLHPVEWSIGEAVGLLLTFANDKQVSPREVRTSPELLKQFQIFIQSEGVETSWDA